MGGHVASSPRTSFVYDHRMYLPDEAAAPTGAFRDGDLKLILGGQSASWYGEFSPNNTGVKPDLKATACPTSLPCLFNVSWGADIGEHHDLASERPAEVKRMLEQFNSLKHTYHPPR